MAPVRETLVIAHKFELEFEFDIFNIRQMCTDDLIHQMGGFVRHGAIDGYFIETSLCGLNSFKYEPNLNSNRDLTCPSCTLLHKINVVLKM